MTHMVPWARRWFYVVAPLLYAVAAHGQRLSSWNEGDAKKRIVAFVQAVTDQAGKDFVPISDRVAVFDNDGTLWSEQPLYFQIQFMLEQVEAQAPKHPEWKGDPAFKALVARDHEAVAHMGLKPILDLVGKANSGMTTEAYDLTIRDWLEKARHPRFNRPYTDLVYEPMRELLDYLREHGFKTYIVSGGSIEFLRPWVEQAYGVPPEQVIGSVSQVTYEVQSGKPVLMRGSKMEFVDDGPGKPVGIYRAIGRRPIAAFGNSDGDLQMLQYTAAGSGARLTLVVHHTDAEREWAYDRASHVGKLDKALDEARAKGWVVVDMKKDWKRIYPFQ
jgi:phosphoglycolate phosphatase-like HAD superfamily hydrolase